MISRHIGFSVFRIMVGMTLLVGGFDKVVGLFRGGFAENTLGNWFIDIIHNETTSGHISVLLPKGLLLSFGYLVPFWELAVGLMVVLGVFRMAGSILGMALIAVFLAGGEAAHAYDYPNMIIDIVQMYVFGFGYFFLYRELCKNPRDPLALDSYVFRSDTSRHSRAASDQ